MNLQVFGFIAPLQTHAPDRGLTSPCAQGDYQGQPGPLLPLLQVLAHRSSPWTMPIKITTLNTPYPAF